MFDMILFIPSEPDIASWTEESNTPRGPPDHHLAGIQYHEPWSRTCKARQTLETLALSGLPFDETWESWTMIKIVNSSIEMAWGSLIDKRLVPSMPVEEHATRDGPAHPR
jgi:hypothetical protein